MTFAEAYERVKPFTILSPERLQGLWNAVHRVNEDDVAGELIECGCFKGGSLAMLGLADDTDRCLIGFDTFEGMPAPSAEDEGTVPAEEGTCKASLLDVEAVLEGLGLDNYFLVKGLFGDTLPGNLNEIAVLHVDCDWYESVKQVLEHLYPQVSVGGVVQVDDYGHWRGCQKAVDEYFAAINVTPKIERLDYTGIQFRKP